MVPEKSVQIIEAIDGSGFFDRFEKAMDGTDTRIRSLEQAQAKLSQEMKNLKEDRCDKNEVSLKELFDSRNAMNLSMAQLKHSATGLTELCRALDVTVGTLDRRGLLLDQGEAGIVGQLEVINNWNAANRLTTLETSVAAINAKASTKKKESSDYERLIFAALLGAILSIGGRMIAAWLS